MSGTQDTTATGVTMWFTHLLPITSNLDHLMILKLTDSEEGHNECRNIYIQRISTMTHAIKGYSNGSFNHNFSVRRNCEVSCNDVIAMI